jgi:hypothetical protein
MSKAFIKCPNCGQENWRFAIKCKSCKASLTKLGWGVIFFLLAFLLASCASPQARALKKINKLIEKHHLQLDTVRTESTDTIFLRDTISIPEIKWDTLVKWKFDSLINVEQDGVKTELRIMRDTLWLRNTVYARDTFLEVKEVTKTITKSVLTPKEIKTQVVPWWVILLLITAVLGWIITLVVTR